MVNTWKPTKYPIDGDDDTTYDSGQVMMGMCSQHVLPIIIFIYTHMYGISYRSVT